MSRPPSPTTYRLVRPRRRHRRCPRLDDHQQRVVDHPGGPLLVLAGPGTGKTTTLVEAIVDRIEHRGAEPDQVLALTFSRKAAEQLRDRVTARLGRTTVDAAELDVPLLRLRPDPPVRPRRALRGAAAAALARPSRTSCSASCSPTTRSRSPGPRRCARALGTRGFAREVHAVLSRAREKGLDGRGPARRSASRPRAAGVRRRRALPRAVPRQPRRPGRHRLRRPDPARDDRGRGPPRRAARAVPPRLRRRVPGHRPRPGRAAAGAGRRRPRPDRRRRPAPVDLRRSAGPRCAASSTSRPTSRRPTAAPPTWWRCAPPAGSARGC